MHHEGMNHVIDDELTLKAPNYFLINHENQRVFFNLKLS